MDSTNEDYKSHGKIKDTNDTNNNNNNTGEKAISTTSKTKNNLGDYKGYFMSVRPPKINYSTIIIKPSSSRSSKQTGKKEPYLTRQKMLKSPLNVVYIYIRKVIKDNKIRDLPVLQFKNVLFYSCLSGMINYINHALQIYVYSNTSYLIIINHDL